MIKKLMMMLALLLPAMMMSGQVAVGDWTLYSPFDGVDEIVETDGYVYYTSGSSLCSIDKDTHEVQTLNVANRLNDTNITGIYPASDGKSVVVAYASGNMDRLYDNGKLANLSDIKDAIMTESRTINDIAFGKDNFYVATDFGVVTYNIAKNEVRETAMIPQKVKKVITTGNTVAVLLEDNQFYLADQGTKLTSADKLKRSVDYDNPTTWIDIKGAGNGYVLGLIKYGKDHNIYRLKMDGTTASVQCEQIIMDNFLSRLRYNSAGTLYAINDKGAVSLDAQGNTVVDNKVKKLQYTPGSTTDFTGPSLSYYGRPSEVWAGYPEGLREIDFTAAGGPAVVQQIGNGNGLNLKEVLNIEIASDGSIYFQSMGERLSLGYSDDSTPERYSTVNRLKGNTFSDATGYDATGKYNTTRNRVWFPLRMVTDPKDPDAYYIGSYYEGIQRIKDNKMTVHYYLDNSTLEDYKGRGCIVQDMKFDKYGNLWAYQVTPDEDTFGRVHVLPADKVGKETTKADWKKFVVPGLAHKKRDGNLVYAEQSNTLLALQGNWGTTIVAIHTKGTASPSDDQAVLVDKYVDQDNREVAFYHLTAGIEDKKGRVWIGTDNGVFEITNPSKLTSGTALVNHLKVPRNDGTNLADYLLTSQMVSDMAVDSSNRKWITTIGSGVYLVSENGDAILEHFTIDNSILPSNNIYSVECDPNSNKVYFGTLQGVLEYNSTSSPGKDDYSEVYAYPNPVRPDYTGWITVAGLMENSLVKITDAAGNVIHQGKSDGGMFTWDGCHSNGERVKTGVYYVMASQNADGTSGAVTKIMVIN